METKDDLASDNRQTAEWVLDKIETAIRKLARTLGIGHPPGLKLVYQGRSAAPKTT